MDGCEPDETLPWLCGDGMKSAASGLPYSKILLPLTRERYPTAEFYFSRSTVDAVNKKITDPIRGNYVVYADGTFDTTTYPNAVRVSHSLAHNITGDFTEITTGAFMLVVSGRIVTGIPMTVGIGEAITMSQSVSGAHVCSYYDASSVGADINFGVHVSGTDYVKILTGIPGGNLNLTTYDGTTVSRATPVSLAAVGASDMSKDLDIVGIIYGAALFQFAGALPANWEVAGLFMGEQFRQGVEQFYPTFQYES